MTKTTIDLADALKIGLSELQLLRDSDARTRAAYINQARAAYAAVHKCDVDPKRNQRLANVMVGLLGIALASRRTTIRRMQALARNTILVDRALREGYTR